MAKRWIQVGLLIATVGCTGWAHSRLPVERAESDGFGFVPDPDRARALTFGYDAIAADYQWLRAVQVVGGVSQVDAPRAEHLGRLVDVVTTLNPHVDHPYRFAAIWLTYDEAQVREGIRLLRRATQYHPGDWRNYFYLGFAQFFYLGEFDLAAESLERAMRQEGAPPYLPRLVARLKAQSRDIGVAEIFLREMLKNTVDPEDRASADRARRDRARVQGPAARSRPRGLSTRGGSGHPLDRRSDPAAAPDAREAPEPRARCDP